jgi:hypothetical protein
MRFAILAAVVNCLEQTCVLLDDFSVPSRFSANRNALDYFQNDDKTMQSKGVENGQLIIVPKSKDSYYYSHVKCIKDMTDYGGISFDIKIPVGSSFSVVISYYPSDKTCDGISYKKQLKTLLSLGYVSDGTKMNIKIPFSAYDQINTKQIYSVLFSGFTNYLVNHYIGPIKLYCSTAPTITTTTISSETTSSALVPTSIGGTCGDIILDDFSMSQRYSLLHYNSLQVPKPTSDDGTMNVKIIDGEQRITLTPKDSSSYFFSQFLCQKDLSNHIGFAFEVEGPKNAAFNIGLVYYKNGQTCGTGFGTPIYKSTTSLGYTIGSKRLIKVPFSAFPGLDLKKFRSISFSGFSKTLQPYRFGPLRFYCTDSTFENPPLPYIKPIYATSVESLSPVPSPYPTGSFADTLLESSQSTRSANMLKYYHNSFDLTFLIDSSGLLLSPATYKGFFYTTFSSNSCSDISKYSDMYIHIKLNSMPPTQDFDIVLHQHNSECDEKKRFPATWRQVQARYYLQDQDIYIPFSHLPIDYKKSTSLAIKYFKTLEPISIKSISIVKQVSNGYVIPPLRPQAPLIFSCTVPNSIALGIDNGDPSLTQKVLSILSNENIKATFFVLGLTLNDSANNLTVAYQEGMSSGHQIAHHSWSHPPLTTVPNWLLNYELDKTSASINEYFNETRFFRPPYGMVNSVLLYELAKRKFKTIMWVINY